MTCVRLFREQTTPHLFREPITPHLASQEPGGQKHTVGYTQKGVSLKLDPCLHYIYTFFVCFIFIFLSHDVFVEACHVIKNLKK